MRDIYGPTAADMKLPNQKLDGLSKTTEVKGLKPFDATKDVVIEYNAAVDLATGTHSNVSISMQNQFGNTTGMVSKNILLSDRSQVYFGNNTNQATNWVFTPTS